MHKMRLALFAIVGLAVATTAILVLDDYAVRKHVKRTMSTKRSLVTEEDRAWWERRVGAVPGDGAPEVNVILPGITGGPALAGNRFHRNGEDGEDGGSADGREWGDMGPFEAVELRNPAGQLRGRLLLSSDTAAYRLVDLGPLAFFERDAVLSPPGPVDNPLDSDEWTRRPRWGRLVGVEVFGVLAGIFVGWFVTARERSRLRTIAARRERSAPSPAPDNLDDRCPACGHDLRAIEELRCSECGAEVGPPGGRARLELADPRWRRRVWLGRSMMAGAVGVLMAALALQVGLYPIGTRVPEIEAHYVEYALQFLERIPYWARLVLAIGAFLFTSADPRERHRRRTWSVRGAVRAAALTVLVLSTLPLWLRPTTRLMGEILWFVATIATPLVLATIVIGSLHRAGTLAARAGAPELARRCSRTVTSSLVAAGAATAVLWAQNVVLWLTWNGYMKLPQFDATELVLFVVPLLATIVVLMALPGPLAELGREWRVALATARRGRPSGTSANEVRADSDAASARAPLEGPRP